MNLQASIRVVFAGALLALVIAPAAPAADRADPCGGSPRCYDAGGFVAEVVQVLPSAAGGGARHQTVSFNIRFRNVSDKPIILGYQTTTSAGTDNFGNRYFWGRAGTYDTSSKGIGLVGPRTADPQFVLAPGQARSATFGLIRYNARPPYGVTFNYDVVIAELEVLPGQQVRTVRQNSVSFTDLAPGR